MTASEKTKRLRLFKHGKNKLSCVNSCSVWNVCTVSSVFLFLSNNNVLSEICRSNFQFLSGAAHPRIIREGPYPFFKITLL
jgi:hypothetical protein